MKQEEFEALAKQNYNRIPIVREVLADLDTPLSVYLKLADGPYSYLFESVQGGEKWGRYSIIGLPCHKVLRVRGNTVQLSEQDKVIEECQVNDPLEYVRQFKAAYRAPEIEGVPRVAGGLVGYFGYETIGYIEPRLAGSDKPDAIDTPDIQLMVSDEVVVFDNLAGKLYIVVYADPSQTDAYASAQSRLTQLHSSLLGPLPRADGQLQTRQLNENDFHSDSSREQYEAAVERAREYIRDGDIMQVVLSQRLSVPYDAPPLNLYRALRTLNPSPYMYFIRLGDFHIVGSSPEILARLEDGTITLRPIAGTRPRGRDSEQDRLLQQELLADPKELAEHLMLVDLGRNDVGRVARIGSVEVTDQMSVERYSHVMHIVSNVSGELLPDKDAIDVLRATFPAGTLSGAPKVRAMEIIDELEPVKRGVYSGAIGYLAWNGNMDTAIAIRTAVIKAGTLYIQAGAGIVADSVPAKEWEETMSKARAVFRAVSMSSAGLDRAISPTPSRGRG